MHIIYMVVLCTWIALQLPLRVLYQRCVDIFRQEWNISQRIFRPNRPIWWTGFIEENMQHRTTYQLSLLWTVTFLMPIFGDGNTISARCHSTCLSAHVSMPLVQPLHGIAYCHWSSATEIYARVWAGVFTVRMTSADLDLQIPYSLIYFQNSLDATGSYQQIFLCYFFDMNYKYWIWMFF